MIKKLNAVSEICKYIFEDKVGENVQFKNKDEKTSAWNYVKGQYRYMCSTLREKAKLPEVLETSGRFSEIDFTTITSRCLSIKTKAYLNEKTKGNSERLFPKW